MLQSPLLCGSSWCGWMKMPQGILGRGGTSHPWQNHLCHPMLQILFLNPVAPFTGWGWDGGGGYNAAAPVCASQREVIKVRHLFLWFRKTNSNHSKRSASCHIEYWVWVPSPTGVPPTCNSELSLHQGQRTILAISTPTLGNKHIHLPRYVLSFRGGTYLWTSHLPGGYWRALRTREERLSKRLSRSCTCYSSVRLRVKPNGVGAAGLYLHCSCGQRQGWGETGESLKLGTCRGK